ncbi:MAG: LysM peptidoglycan-binding domain-containing protein [Treponema sp.]|nr:LysM peptidoglycan-binding domain-containing protein [Treponema sp.]
MRHFFSIIICVSILFAVHPVFGQTDESAAAEETSAEVIVTDESVIAEESPAESTEEAVIAEESPVEQAEPEEVAVAEETGEETEIPESIRNNEYFLKSQELAKQAEEAYEAGDYDLSTQLAQESLEFSALSDQYIAEQMTIKGVYDSIETAKARIDWAVSSGIPETNPDEFNEAQEWYETSQKAAENELWNEAISAADKVIDLLAFVESPDGKSPLPAVYTVRTWNTERDCFWNIAGRPWAYGDPFKWRLIYEANKSKLPDPNNPNIIEPGIVLEIPSLQGEVRQGEWSSSKSY